MNCYVGLTRVFLPRCGRASSIGVDSFQPTDVQLGQIVPPGYCHSMDLAAKPAEGVDLVIEGMTQTIQLSSHMLQIFHYLRSEFRVFAHRLK